MQTAGDLHRFDADFLELMGNAPFRWQRRLFEYLVVERRIPSHLDLPTGLGKTSVMAIWYLAWKAGAPVPRRLVYVVDRRAVVDQATRIAEQIKKAAGKKKENASDHVLSVSTLRGQHADNREWLNDPAAPAIIVGTVDMIGSRLLFSGYGVSRRMRPYHAGLLGADTLVVLDESHLVPPFEKLLDAIAHDAGAFAPRDEAVQKWMPPFRLLSLSATARGRKEGAFRLEDADVLDEHVKNRLGAKKRLSVARAPDGKLEKSLADEAWALADQGTKAIRCLIYCDRREVAVDTAAAIEKLAKAAKLDVETERFVGGRRIRERTDAADRLAELGFLAGSEKRPENPVFLCATSAGEVGVDLDADHMVCDLVSWERMVQRFGRVNRRGEGDARIVLVQQDEPKPKKPDDPTPKERRAMIAWNSRALLDALPADERGIDVSPGALYAFNARGETDADLAQQLANATTPEPLRPALNRATVDAWSMTSLEAHMGRPDVGPWLRGWTDDEPQTTVVWRRFLPVRTSGGKASPREIEEFFEAAPPHASEQLETETWRVADWLLARGASAAKAAAMRASRSGNAPIEEDAGSEDAEARPPPLRSTEIIAFVLTSAGGFETGWTLNDFAEDSSDKRFEESLNADLAGRTLVVDVRIAGLKDGLLDKDADDLPRTADDRAPWIEREGRSIAGFRIYRSRTKDSAPDEDWRFEDDFVAAKDEEGEATEWLIVERHKGSKSNQEGRSVARPQSLEDHQAWVARRARHLARAVGLDEEYVEVLAMAACFHDEGKKAARWQRAFNASKADAAVARPLAKTRGPFHKSVLDGYRHEFGSLPFAERDADFKKLEERNPQLADLVLHLIASHHGGARPVISRRSCDDAPPEDLAERARDVALRFARLQKRWGPWGLAWWEALLRAADQQASRENEQGEDAPAAPDRKLETV